MKKVSRRISLINKSIDLAKEYEIDEAIALLKRFASVKFIESVDVAINLAIDSKKSDQNIRAATVLPNGIGKEVRTVVFAQGENALLAKQAGAEIVGMENIAERIKKGECNFDVVIASPDTMHIVSPLGTILGPRGLMPNPKMGTITNDITKAVQNAKAGQIHYRNDKNGIIHATIGKVSFSTIQLKENLECFLFDLKKAKPSSVKGNFFKKISVSTTMGAGLSITQSSISKV
ncbi:50S ribosomal protein L1 [Candidatus Photodesmus katoptron]|uniref:Large ribosomal subunit protein uL1 n=1 Tax=Candidatus Photodesmus katoptron Akat1 TaxID=1236703 RepID=S3DIG9_9GAMM|nr:50S ribosomal protein L1 [Candidatus Photodesmus katoptron]EPE37515.1 ribosomal protein L1 [Candidatus Photodesmus katoptron Akat1]KEY90344.1 50S ribosomal protein L1 [Candidatus Photodesmus katoptron]